MGTKIQCAWQGGLSFNANSGGHQIMIDSPESEERKGAGPKSLLLVGLAGCSGMDVISILKKMQVEPEEFHIEVDGNQTDEHPKVFHSIHITYHFKGKDLPKDKLEKAINLSLDKYCGVNAMLNKSADVKYSIVINE